MNPVGIPPLDRIHKDPVHDHGKVEVIPAGKSGLTGVTDKVALLDVLSGYDRGLTEVSIKGGDALAMVQQDGNAVDTKPIRKNHPAVVPGLDR